MYCLDLKSFKSVSFVYILFAIFSDEVQNKKDCKFNISYLSSINHALEHSTLMVELERGSKTTKYCVGFQGQAVRQVLHPAFDCVNTIQKVCRPIMFDLVQVPWICRDKPLLHCQKRLFSCLNKYVLCFLTNILLSTTVKAFCFEEYNVLTQQLLEWRCRENS